MAQTQTQTHTSPIKCFLLEKTGRVKRALRRYSSADAKCLRPNQGEYDWGHDATVQLDEVDAASLPHGRSVGHFRDSSNDVFKSIPRDDPRWPRQCDCGYLFADQDEYALDLTAIYRRTDTGEERALFPAEPGQMWFVGWGPQGQPGSIYYQQRAAHGDARHLMCYTPGGTWDLDAKSSNGEGWQWEGTPPNVTATPSILMDQDGYHGWLRNGYLVDA